MTSDSIYDFIISHGAVLVNIFFEIQIKILFNIYKNGLTA